MAAMFLPYTTDLVTALGWTILHSLWQALVVFACLRIVLKLWPGATASTKYNLSFLSLAGIFGWFVVTLYEQLDAMKQLHTASSLLVAENGANAVLLNMPVVYQNQQELTGMLPSLEICFPILVGLYVAGVGVMCIKLVADLAQLQQIRKSQILPVDPAWEQYLQKLARQLQVPSRVKLLISQHIQVPVMMGFLKPVILLPIAMFNNLSAEQLEAILLHELAHVKRNDYILNIFQSIVETTLFFNPFVWWISKYIRLEREHCCDDMVIAHTAQPLHYAKALVVLEEYRFTNNPMAMAAADNKQHLFYRIKRIMEMKTSHLNYSQKFMAVVIIATGLTAIAWITPSAKQGTKGVATEETASPAAVVMSAAVAQPAAQPLPMDTVPPKAGTPAAQPNGDAWESKEAEPGTAAQDDVWKEKLSKDQWQSVKEAQKQAKIAQDAAQKAMKEAMKNIDWKSINEQTAKALKAVDWNQINKEISASMKAVDWNQINKEVENALKESKNQVDPEMIKQSVEMGLKSAQTALANLDIQNIIQQSMMQVQRSLNQEQREGMRKDMQKAREEQQEAMREARDQIREAQKQARDAQQQAMADAREKAREAAGQARDAQRKAEEQAHVSRDKYQQLIKQLQEDKLIEAGKPFTIEKKNNDLYINGTKQSATIMDKYRPYLDGKNITIKGGNDNLDVNVNN